MTAAGNDIAGQPKLLLADEPTGNLDPDTGRTVREHLSAFARQQGGLVIIVTHDPAVEEVADRVLRLESGRRVEQSPAVPARTRDSACLG